MFLLLKIIGNKIYITYSFFFVVKQWKRYRSASDNERSDRSNSTNSNDSVNKSSKAAASGSTDHKTNRHCLTLDIQGSESPDQSYSARKKSKHKDKRRDRSDSDCSPSSTKLNSGSSATATVVIDQFIVHFRVFCFINNSSFVHRVPRLENMKTSPRQNKGKAAQVPKGNTNRTRRAKRVSVKDPKVTLNQNRRRNDEDRDLTLTNPDKLLPYRSLLF